MSLRFRWSKESYDILFRISIALNNSRIRLHSLRAHDHVIYDQLLGSLASIALDVETKRARRQARYQARRRRRLAEEHDIAHRLNGFDSDEEQDLDM